jgi:hypothetical protein
MIASNRRTAKAQLPTHTAETSRKAASFMAEQKAELKAVRARPRREPGRARLEDTLDDVLEADVDFDPRHWHLTDTNFIREKPPPKPKDTHKQSTLPECLTSA